MLKRTTIIFGVCGFFIAILLGIVWMYLAAHTSVNPHNTPFLSSLTDWLWPSNLMLMAWRGEGGWNTALGLFLSAIVNGIIYSVVGFVFGGLFKFFLMQQQRE
jgi:hypothetical protein